MADLLVLRARLRAVMESDPHAINGKYQIRSLYFDNPDDKALREKIDGVNRREKFRIRLYNGNASVIHLEKKSRINGLGAKFSADLTAGEAQKIVDGELDWMLGADRPLVRELYCKMRAEGLRPKTIVDYTREPFIYRPGNVRVTLDYDIRTGRDCTELLNPGAVTIPAGDAPILLEVKWDAFLKTAASEEYTVCSVVIDNTAVKNVAIRGKGNTSLSTVATMGSERYSFKLEFDHYEAGKSYKGLDKLCLNNLIQDNTCMKDYLAYRLMDVFGVDTPLCSYVWVMVNGEDWGLYLAVEAVEDSFMERVYGGEGDLYKPDSLSMGGGPGNGRDFNIEDFINENGETMGFGRNNSQENGGSGEKTPSQDPENASGFPPSPPGDASSFPGMPGGFGKSGGFGGGAFGAGQWPGGDDSGAQSFPPRAPALAARPASARRPPFRRAALRTAISLALAPAGRQGQALRTGRRAARLATSLLRTWERRICLLLHKVRAAEARG